MFRMNAEERAIELYKLGHTNLPVLAQEYILYLGQKYGYCGEIVMTAVCRYVQYIEKLKNDLISKINQENIVWLPIAHKISLSQKNNIEKLKENNVKVDENQKL